MDKVKVFGNIWRIHRMLIRIGSGLSRKVEGWAGNVFISAQGNKF